MTYSNYKNTNYNQKPGNNNRNSRPEPPMIDVPLAQYYSNNSEIYLQNGIAYKIASELKDLPTHQIRKILSQTKSALEIAEDNPKNFKQAQKRLFALLPLAAYNAGRNKAAVYKILYNFVKSNISEKTITTVEDIQIFDQLVTSIVAYHKFLGGK